MKGAIWVYCKWCRLHKVHNMKFWVKYIKTNNTKFNISIDPSRFEHVEGIYMYLYSIPCSIIHSSTNLPTAHARWFRLCSRWPLGLFSRCCRSRWGQPPCCRHERDLRYIMMSIHVAEVTLWGVSVCAAWTSRCSTSSSSRARLCVCMCMCKYVREKVSLQVCVHTEGLGHVHQ